MSDEQDQPQADPVAPSPVVTKPKGEEFYLDVDHAQIAAALGLPIDGVAFELIDAGENHTLTGAPKAGA